MMNCASARFFSAVFRVSHKVRLNQTESMCTEEGRLRTIGVALSFKVGNSWSKLDPFITRSYTSPHSCRTAPPPPRGCMARRTIGDRSRRQWRIATIGKRSAGVTPREARVAPEARDHSVGPETIAPPGPCLLYATPPLGEASARQG